jgi:hypothetical protein
MPIRAGEGLRTDESSDAVTDGRFGTTLRLASKHTADKIARAEVSADTRISGRRYRRYAIAADA